MNEETMKTLEALAKVIPNFPAVKPWYNPQNIQYRIIEYLLAEGWVIMLNPGTPLDDNQTGIVPSVTIQYCYDDSITAIAPNPDTPMLEVLIDAAAKALLEDSYAKTD
jgi:hypothetical protein